MPVPQTRILVADDSALVRKVLIDILSADEGLSVIGEAQNGKEAVEKTLALGPHLVIMDIEMPVMDGLTAIEIIMKLSAVPILVVSSRGDASTAYAAISKGALEIFPKWEINADRPDDFIRTVKLLSTVKVISHLTGKDSTTKQGPGGPKTCPRRRMGPLQAVAIAVSTGGPRALSILLPDLPADLPCPVLISQHISDGFISGLVHWLGKISKLKLKVAEEGEPIRSGTVYFAPSEANMAVEKDTRIALRKRMPTDIYRPSCNLLLSSVADAYGASCVGVIMTGMGSDGVEGMRRIKLAGGITIAQDERSSAVFGMPREAIAGDCIQKVLPLKAIAREIIELVCKK